ncbi:B-cell antigen receptor complex-associated protein alpha chain [Oryzias latipes]|uniref:CD79a molecule, immunoglobulin-associated alpha n=1 Tax=Oryzias latipes TaxID=8090 RepID=A0A3B3ICK9_ORYLA|nr:B-cell antigen receptor complex-associated protein alpha chain [Oryzias latipes]
MAMFLFFVSCSMLGGIVEAEVVLGMDRPFQRIRLSDRAELKCCFQNWDKGFHWVKSKKASERVEEVAMSELVTATTRMPIKNNCSILTFKSVQLNDTGMYLCRLNVSFIHTHGTYMQVYVPMEKTINLSESTKNLILMTEGILLFLCVVGPSFLFLSKKKHENKQVMKKEKMEEENIYQGLDLDDCCTAYDHIERPQGYGHYQDVGTTVKEGEEIQLEKP